MCRMQAEIVVGIASSRSCAGRLGRYSRVCTAHLDAVWRWLLVYLDQGAGHPDPIPHVDDNDARCCPCSPPSLLLILLHHFCTAPMVGSL